MVASGQTNQSSGGFVYWVLLILGFSVFTPCVLWPEWRDQQSLVHAQQEAQQHLDSIQQVVDHEKRMLMAMQTDPGVIARIAQRDLHFVRWGERAISVDVASITENQFEDNNGFVQEQGERYDSKFVPPMLEQIANLIPDLDYDQIFSSNQTRSILMVMSISLIALSFILFGGRAASKS